MQLSTLFTTIAILIFASVGIANPTQPSQYGYCLTDTDAKTLVDDVVELFTVSDQQLARDVLTKNFKVFSDSTNFVTPNGPPLGAPTSKNRREFIQQHSQTDPNAPTFTVLDYFHDCSKIVFRWVLNATPDPVRGIDVLETVHEDGKWLVKTDYSEFNNGALLYNFGFCPAPCQS